jgi:ankyrin repeat protein
MSNASTITFRTVINVDKRRNIAMTGERDIVDQIIYLIDSQMFDKAVTLIQGETSVTFRRENDARDFGSIACKHNRSDLFIMLAARCNMEVKPHHLLVASKYGYINMIKTILIYIRTNDNIGLVLANAASMGHLDVVNYLIDDEEADLTYDGYLAFHLSAINGHAHVLKRLLEFPIIDHSFDECMTLRCTALNGHAHIINILLRLDNTNAASKNSQALRNAAEYGHYDVVVLLLACPDVDPTVNGRYAKSLAQVGGHRDIAKLIEIACDKWDTLTHL